MIRSAVTVSLVAEARGGPFVFWDNLDAAVRQAAELGFDAVEIFAPSADTVEVKSLRKQLDAVRLKVAAVGTGAGWVKHKLTLTSNDESVRDGAARFIESIIDLGAEFAAPAIIGSMQGRWADQPSRAAAFDHLRAGLNRLGGHAATRNVPLIYEPLNRYETNFCNTVADGVKLLGELETDNVRLLADLFHMNIEEADLGAALRQGAAAIGHVHFVDSNRRPAGCGHLDYGPIAAALEAIRYDGYTSAEAFPWPDPTAAARKTIDTFRRVFRSGTCG